MVKLKFYSIYRKKGGVLLKPDANTQQEKINIQLTKDIEDLFSQCIDILLSRKKLIIFQQYDSIYNKQFYIKISTSKQEDKIGNITKKCIIELIEDNIILFHLSIFINIDVEYNNCPHITFNTLQFQKSLHIYITQLKLSDFIYPYKKTDVITNVIKLFRKVYEGLNEKNHLTLDYKIYLKQLKSYTEQSLNVLTLGTELVNSKNSATIEAIYSASTNELMSDSKLLKKQRISRTNKTSDNFQVKLFKLIEIKERLNGILSAIKSNFETKIESNFLLITEIFKTKKQNINYPLSILGDDTESNLKKYYNYLQKDIIEFIKIELQGLKKLITTDKDKVEYDIIYKQIEILLEIDTSIATSFQSSIINKIIFILYHFKDEKKQKDVQTKINYILQKRDKIIYFERLLLYIESNTDINYFSLSESNKFVQNRSNRLVEYKLIESSQSLNSSSNEDEDLVLQRLVKLKK